MNLKDSTLRIIVSALIGIAFMTGWLVPIYESIVGGAFLVPRYWNYFHGSSLLALLILGIALRKQNRNLALAAWFGLALSLIPDLLPGLA